MSNVTLSSVHEATELLSRLLTDENFEPPSQITLADELANLRICIDGARYDRTVPGTLARGIWELQQEIYRAVAHTIIGADNFRRISGNIEDYTLVFRVEPGSTELSAILQNLLDTMSGAIASMDSRHKAITLIGIAVVLVSGYGLVSILTNHQDNQARIALEQERTRQFQVIAEAARQVPTIHRWQDAAAKGAKSVVKSASDADSIRIGSASVNKEQIKDINARAARESAETEAVTGEFRVIQIRRQDSGLCRFTLVSANGEIPAVLDQDAFETAQINHLWQAAQHDVPVALELQITRIGDSVKRAWVSDIPMPAGDRDSVPIL